MKGFLARNRNRAKGGIGRKRQAERKNQPLGRMGGLQDAELSRGLKILARLFVDAHQRRKTKTNHALSSPGPLRLASYLDGTA